MIEKYQALTHSALLAALEYHPGSGVFVWRRRAEERKQDKSFNTLFAGKRAGVECPRGYRQICLNQAVYREHILAWFYMTARWPEQDIDHKNTIKRDNRWRNLRLATPAQNGANVEKRARNKCGAKGVSKCSSTGRFRVSITVRGKYHYLGRHNTLESARHAYALAAAKHFKQFARA